LVISFAASHWTPVLFQYSGRRRPAIPGARFGFLLPD
jgi:hypothetical protein